MNVLEWKLESVIEAHPGLYLEHCAVMAAAVLKRLSPPPCRYQVECVGFGVPNSELEQTFPVDVSWSDQTALAADRIWRTEQPKPVVERATVALAALAFANLFPDGQMRVTAEGDRADYWLPNLECALEISGTQQVRHMKRRQREKKLQLLANPRHWNGYVFVACFSTGSQLIHWSYHTQEEGKHGSPENATPD